MKKVLICGATGFIGRNMAEAFAADTNLEVYATYHKVKPFFHPSIKFINVDLTNPNSVSSAVEGKDLIIQAAATTSGAKDIVNRPYIHVTDNAVMNSLIFRSAFEHKVSHVVFFSCSVMYPSDQPTPLKESDFDANAEIHKNYFGAGWTKVYLEKMCEFYSRFGETKYTVIRHSNIYGPYDKYDLEKSHVFGATLTKVLTNESGKLVVWGDGSEERDLLYISDLVQYVKLAVRHQKNAFQLQNVGLGKSISVDNLVKKIIAASGKKILIEYDVTKPSLKTKVCLDITEAGKMGWKPEVSLDEGIQKTISWYQSEIQMNLPVRKTG